MPIYELNCGNKYYTLYKNIRRDILSGRLKGGEKLPSKRVFARELGVSVVTVQLAYEQLLAEGYILSRERSGYYVEKILPQDTPADLIAQNRENRAREQTAQSEGEEGVKIKADFVKGATPAKLFPFSVWAKLMRSVLNDCGEHLLERVPCEGDAELRGEIAEYLYRSRGITADPRNIVIGAGAEYLYGVVVRLIGRNKLYAVENPGYPKIAAAYSLNGAKFLPVAVKETGICVEELQNSAADALHISPSHQFPTGAVTPAPARSRIIEWARAGGKYIIEDDYDSEFRLAGKPLHSLYSLCPERVIYMNTFSKTLAPSMRMGYMVLPPALFARFLDMFSESANVVPLFEQKTLALMLKGGYFERHINRLKNYYRGIRRAIYGALEKSGADCEIYDTGSGLHLLARFNGAASDVQIKEEAAKRGIRLKCLSDYLSAPLEGVEKFAVINYSGVTYEQLSKL